MKWLKYVICYLFNHRWSTPCYSFETDWELGRVCWRCGTAEKVVDVEMDALVERTRQEWRAR